MYFKIFIVCDKRSFGIIGEGGLKGDILISLWIIEYIVIVN